MKTSLLLFLVLIFGAASMNRAQNSKPVSFVSPRLKPLVFPDSPILGTDRYRIAKGIWVSDSDDPKKALVVPMQVQLECYGQRKECIEFGVTLGGLGPVIDVDTFTQSYDVDTWDANGLTASYGGDDLDSPCQRHVLAMDFKSGAVTVTDIPTHKPRQDCKPFQEANGYRLKHGLYAIDLTPNNDLDKKK